MSARLVQTSWESQCSIRNSRDRFQYISVWASAPLGMSGYKQVEADLSSTPACQRSEKTNYLPARLLPEEILEGVLGMQKVSRGIEHVHSVTRIHCAPLSYCSHFCSSCCRALTPQCCCAGARQRGRAEHSTFTCCFST